MYSIFCVCVPVAVVIQHAKRMRRNITYLHLWPVRLYQIFFITCHKQYDFREKVIEH